MRSTPLLALTLLAACRAPAPCSGHDDCPSNACINGGCAPLDSADAARPDADLDAASRDAGLLDAGLLDVGPVDAAGDLPDVRPSDGGPSDARADMPCELPEIDLDLIEQIAPLARGESYAFEVRHEPSGLPLTVEAPFGTVQREGPIFEWAPRGGNPGDLPWPWWTGPVELTVIAGAPGCTVTERFTVEVVGDVVIFDEVSGVLWVLGSDGRLLGQWVQVPGNGVTALAVGRSPRTLLAAVRQVDARGRYLVHRLDDQGAVIATLEPDDFRTGARTLANPARAIVILSGGQIVAAGGGEDALPFWGRDDRVEALVPVSGAVATLGGWDGKAAYTLRDQTEVLALTPDARLQRLGNAGLTPNALFRLHDPAELLFVAGAEWNRLGRYAMGEFVDLIPPPQGTDVRAWTPFGAGYLTYDRQNRKLHRYDERLRSVIDPRFELEIPGITVGGLLWLDQR